MPAPYKKTSINLKINNVMKKIFLSIAVLTAAALWTGCEPIVDKHDAGGGIAATELQATATAVVQNGKNSNRVYVHCTSPVLCQWSDGVNTLAATEGYLTLLLTGEQTITLTAKTADGATLTKSFTVNVEELTEPVDPVYGQLFGAGEKTWAWASSNCFGNGGDSDNGPAWWILNPAEMADQCSGKNLPADGQGATMKFVLSGKQMTKVTTDGQTFAGRLTFDMSAGKEGWSVGTITFANTNILCGYDFNDATFSAWSTYNIISIDDTRMVLGAQEHDPNSNYWYWVFVPVP
ncbi:hypothetical protein FACS189456_0680 [Bacteroidia bacterium]|nr:hypothetical protein FACS189456_0680 [Bacteroidia bacterium]